MILRFLLFFTVSTLVFLLLSYYVGRRLIKPLKIGRTGKRLLWLGIFLNPLLIPLSFMLRFGSAGSPWVDVFSWITYLGMGFFSLVLALLVMRDIGWGVLFIYRRVREWFKNKSKSGPQENASLPYDSSRRQFLINSLNFGIMGASGILSGYGLYEARRKPILEEIEIAVPNLPQDLHGFRIVQFTDVHVGPTIRRRFVESVVNQINHLQPDLIVCTGDMVDGSVPELSREVEPVKDLSAPHGVYFVTGNHEYYSGAESWIDELQRFDMKVLLNEHRMLNHKNGKILLAGVNDYTASQFIRDHTSDPHKALLGAGTADLKILLAHQPRNIFEASGSGYDLQLSGHTHGGQYIPWNYLVALTQPYISGLHQHDDTWIYVNRGTGYWGPPLRLGVPSEVTLIRLVPQNSV